MNERSNDYKYQHDYDTRHKLKAILGFRPYDDGSALWVEDIIKYL